MSYSPGRFMAPAVPSHLGSHTSYLHRRPQVLGLSLPPTKAWPWQPGWGGRVSGTRAKQPWSTDPTTLRNSQHRLLQTICKGERQRMLQGRQFVLPRSPGAVSCGTDPPPSQAEPCPGAARPQRGAKSSFLLLPPPPAALEAQIPACMNSRMPGYHQDAHEIQTQGHRCTNPVMENVLLGRFGIRRFFVKYCPDQRSQVRFFSTGDPSSPAALGLGGFNYGKSLQATLTRKHSPACPLPTKRSS